MSSEPSRHTHCRSFEPNNADASAATASCSGTCMQVCDRRTPITVVRFNKYALMHLTWQARVAEILTAEQLANRSDAYLQVPERRRVTAVTEVDLPC